MNGKYVFVLVFCAMHLATCNILLSPSPRNHWEDGKMIRENLLREAILNPEPVFNLPTVSVEVDEVDEVHEDDTLSKTTSALMEEGTVSETSTTPVAAQKQQELAKDLDLDENKESIDSKTVVVEEVIGEDKQDGPPTLIIGGSSGTKVKPNSHYSGSSQYHQRDASQVINSAVTLERDEAVVEEVIALKEPLNKVDVGHDAKDMICDVHHTVAMVGDGTEMQLVGGSGTSTATTLRCYRLNLDSVHFDAKECKTTEEGHVVCEKQIMYH